MFTINLLIRNQVLILQYSMMREFLFSLWCVQESVYPPMNTCFYKYGFPDAGTAQYYDYSQAYEVNSHEPRMGEHRRPSGNSSAMANAQAAVHTEWDGNENSMTHENHVECKCL